MQSYMYLFLLEVSPKSPRFALTISTEERGRLIEKPPLIEDRDFRCRIICTSFGLMHEMFEMFSWGANHIVSGLEGLDTFVGLHYGGRELHSHCLHQ